MTPIRTRLFLKPSEAKFLPMLKKSFFQATHLESRQLQYQRAAQRLADRAAQAQLFEEMMKVKLLADEKHKSIGILTSSGDVLKQKISDLSARRGVLLAELK